MRPYRYAAPEQQYAEGDERQHAVGNVERGEVDDEYLQVTTPSSPRPNRRSGAEPMRRPATVATTPMTPTDAECHLGLLLQLLDGHVSPDLDLEEIDHHDRCGIYGCWPGGVRRPAARPMAGREQDGNPRQHCCHRDGGQHATFRIAASSAVA